MKKNITGRIVAAFFIVASFSIKAQFTSGNLVVLQIGDGVSTMTSQGNPITLNEYNPGGTLTYSVPIPSTGTNALVLRGNATSEGYISRSADGSQIVFGAYNQALPNSTALNSAAPTTIPRSIAMVNASGALSVVATSTASFAAGDIRGAAATDIQNFWGTSSSQGANYYGSAAAATNVENTKTNLRATHVFNNQLYISSQVASGTPTDIGVYAVGTGTPNTASQTVTTVINAGTGAQPGQFYFNSANTICYVADARSNSAGGGVQKWIYSSNTWTLAYTLPTSTNSGAFGVVADFSGSNPIVYATSNESNGNHLVSIIDAGASSTFTTLATASANYIFRGLAFSPGASSCIPVSITTITNNSPLCSTQNIVLNCSLGGSAPYSYTWTGSGQFSSQSVASPTVTGAVSGPYTLQVSNACGTASAVTNVSINPTPTILVNASTICAGGVATITASGATTYSWNTGSTSASFTASPTSNTNYTVTGTSLGCSGTATTNINITTSPTLSINTATVCAGMPATLTASGASSYSWNIGPTTGVVIVSPTVTTVYTVIATAAGCPNSFSATTQVNVLPVPSVSITAAASTVCPSSNSLVLTGLPAGGTYTGTAVSNGNFNASAAGAGTFVVGYVVTGTNNCSNTATTQIVVFPAPSVSLSAAASTVCLNNSSVALTGLPAGGTYTGTGVSGNNFNATSAGAGTFVVSYKYTDPNSCSNTATISIKVISCSGISETRGKPNVNLWPNPAQTELWVTIDGGQPLSSVDIIDLTGKKVLSSPLQTSETKLNISTLEKGVYIVRLYGMGQTINKRLVKE